MYRPIAECELNRVKFLIFDADDTLWKNNLYYETARAEFIALCKQYSLTENSFDHIFDELEWQVVQDRGYGSKNFIIILETLYKKFPFLENSPAASKDYRTILNKFIDSTSNPPELFEGVRTILDRLSHKYEIYVLTKGDQKEQTRKLAESGLASLFRKAFVVPEKNLKTYFNLLEHERWNPDDVCMIGNSPKSDINPALHAGMWAVYIPYQYTWKLDNEPVLKYHPRLIEIKQIGELGRYFG